jgi:antitoxin component YwqK of YwqJK toxin-antitoxin module
VLGTCLACGRSSPPNAEPTFHHDEPMLDDAEPTLDDAEKRAEVPAREVSANQIVRARGRVSVDNEPYSGFVVERHADGSLAARAGYIGGLAEGWHEAWYPDGRKRHRKYYEAGKREGEHLGWRPTGALEFRRHYLDDLSHGKQEFFQLGGRLVEEKHFDHGHEQGLQRGWNGEGELVMNYTVKNGRRYGIVGRSDCISVVDP